MDGADDRRARTAYVGLGSNLGPRGTLLSRALSELSGPGVEVRRVSSVYETEPVGPVREQPAFYNAVAELATTLSPPDLLARCLSAEEHLGRRRGVAKGPRAIDLDLLLVDDLVGQWPGLVLPHPELTARAFVLRPLLELDPSRRDPRDGAPLSLALLRVHDQRARRLGDLPTVVAAERAAELRQSARSRRGTARRA